MTKRAGISGGKRVRLSIVSSLYNSAPFLEEFHRRVVAAAEQITDQFEIILVNDGSPDDALAVAIELHQADQRVTVVDLSRNFGHHRAMMAGLMCARGELVFLIDCDLEEDPAVLPGFLVTMQKESCDVVYGVQKARRGTKWEEASGTLFYWILERLGGTAIPRNMTTARLMSRRYVRNLVRHQEREMIISGLWVATGFRQVPQAIEKLRLGHRSNYSFWKKLRMVIDHITVFSAAILYAILYFGLAVSVLSFFMLLYFVARYAWTGNVRAGWTSTIASVWMFGGLSIFLISFVGIYVAQIFNETKRRPYVIVRAVYGAIDRNEEGALGLYD